MNIDLHCHSTASDGQLRPLELCRRAENLGIEILSITDHDTMTGYENLRHPYADALRLIHGIEFSTQYRNVGIHILGLNVSPDNATLRKGIVAQQEIRMTRAERIAKELVKQGMENPLPALRLNSPATSIGRLHFARHLVDTGQVKDVAQAFKKYLGRGRPCHVRQTWTPMEEIIGWIRDAGGIAVLAHPAKYNLTGTKLSALTDAFGAAGGQGMEVVSGQQHPDLTRKLARLSREKDLLASCGSDFHEPGRPWAELGRFPPLPAGCRPVWADWLRSSS